MNKDEIKFNDEKLNWSIGDIIADIYEVKSILGEGAMGIVYKVHHKQWDIDLAVKSPKSQILTEKGWEGFIKEAETWVNLGLHPNIASCYYVRQLGEVPRIFAEYVDGGSLEDWIQNRKLYKGTREEILERIIDIAIQSAWGLQHAHEQGLVHQDVKPANILLSLDGTVKVTDFGIAKARIRAGEKYQPLEGETIMISSGGMTPAYCSPEQSEKKSISRKTDIWSWAVSVLEMFFGGVHWLSGILAESVLNEYLKNNDENQNIVVIPDKLVKLLRQCFKYEPNERPKDFKVVSNRLIEIYNDLVQTEYNREIPVPLELLADSLNNKAISFIDLGRYEKTVKIFDEALSIEPLHPESVYNRGLILWRTGKIDDINLIKQLEDVKLSKQDDWRPNYYLGLIHLERGDAEQAVNEFEDSIRKSVENHGKKELEIAKDGLNKWSKLLKTYYGHKSRINTVSFSQNMKYIHSVDDNKTVKLWDFYSLKCLETFTILAEWGNSFYLLPDGYFAHRLNDKNEIELIDFRKKNCVLKIKKRSDWTKHICFSKDFNFMLIGCNDNTLKLWDINKDQCLIIYKNDSFISSMCFLPDNKYVLTGDYNWKLKLWDIDSGKLVRSYEGHTDWIESICLSSDGKIVISGSDDKTIKIWDIQSGKCLRTFLECNETSCVSLSIDGKYALSGSDDHTVKLWRIYTEMKKSRFIINKPEYISIIKKETQIYSQLIFNANQELNIGNVRSAYSFIKDALKIKTQKNFSTIKNLYFKIGNKSIKSHLKEAHLTKTFKQNDAIKYVCFSKYGNLIISYGFKNKIQIWDVNQNDKINDIETQSDKICVSQDGKYALSESIDHSIILWDINKGICLHTYEGINSNIETIRFSQNNDYVLASSEDSTLKIWSLKTQKCLKTFETRNKLRLFNLTPNNKLLLYQIDDISLVSCDLINGEYINKFDGHKDLINTFCISPNGKLVATGSGSIYLKDISIKIWNIDSGRLLNTLEGHDKPIRALCFSPNGNFILSGSYDKTIKLWDINTSSCIRTFNRHTGWINAVNFSSDGNYLVSGSFDHTIQLWQLIWDYDIPETSNWDEKARPYLEIFLKLHRPYSTDELSRVGKPVWDENDFENFYKDLENRDYGWLKKEGVRTKLEKMTKEWKDNNY